MCLDWLVIIVFICYYYYYLTFCANKNVGFIQVDIDDSGDLVLDWCWFCLFPGRNVAKGKKCLAHVFLFFPVYSVLIIDEYFSSTILTLKFMFNYFKVNSFNFPF